jgi:hypothetical protein
MFEVLTHSPSIFKAIFIKYIILGGNFDVFFAKAVYVIFILRSGLFRGFFPFGLATL